MSKEGWGEKKTKRAWDDEKGKERKRDLFPLPIVPRALAIFFLFLLHFLLGYQIAASAEESESLPGFTRKVYFFSPGFYRFKKQRKRISEPVYRCSKKKSQKVINPLTNYETGFSFV